MTTPLGLTAGNAIEVAESVEVLAGGGPADVVELTLALAREMLAGAGVTDVDPADKLADGSAMDAWKAMIRAQDGDPDADAADGPGVPRRGRAGVAACSPGSTRWRSAWPPGGSAPAGPARRTRCRPAPASSGTPGPGDEVTEGQPLFTLHTDEPERFDRALASLRAASTSRARDGVRAEPAGHRPRQRDRVDVERSHGTLPPAGGSGVPVDATEVTTDDYRLRTTRTIQRADGPGRRVRSAELLEVVHRTRPSRPCARSCAGGSTQRSEPADTEPQLAALGRRDERLEILALPGPAPSCWCPPTAVAEVPSTGYGRSRPAPARSSRMSPTEAPWSADPAAALPTRSAGRVPRCTRSTAIPAAAGGPGTVDVRAADGSAGRCCRPGVPRRGLPRPGRATGFRGARATRADVVALVKAVD